MRNLFIHSSAALLLFLVAGPAGAQHFDVSPYQLGGQVQIGGYDLDDFDTEAVVEIFEGELGEIGVTGQYEGDEPGFFACDAGSLCEGDLPGSALPATADVDLNIVLGYGGRSLSYWDGLGAVSFGATVGSEVLKIEDYNAATSVLDGTVGIADIYVGPTDGDGGLHDHVEFTLNGDNSGTPDAVNQGIYLLEATLSVDGLADSESFYILLAAFSGLSDEIVEGRLHDAEHWVEDNLVPEPGSVLLVVSGLAGILALGRRRS